MNAAKPIEASAPSAPPAPPADCLRCGVCCFSALEAFVRVDGADWTRLGGEAERVAHFLGNRAFMKMREGHCAALELRNAPDGYDVSGGAGMEYFCTVYEKRPQICRDLARGSPECMGELTAKAERTARAST